MYKIKLHLKKLTKTKSIPILILFILQPSDLNFYRNIFSNRLMILFLKIN